MDAERTNDSVLFKQFNTMTMNVIY